MQVRTGTYNYGYYSLTFFSPVCQVLSSTMAPDSRGTRNPKGINTTWRSYYRYSLCIVPLFWKRIILVRYGTYVTGTVLQVFTIMQGKPTVPPWSTLPFISSLYKQVGPIICSHFQDSSRPQNSEWNLVITLLYLYRITQARFICTCTMTYLLIFPVSYVSPHST